MGFNPFKAITRAVGLPDKSPVTKILQIATAPIFLPTQLAVSAGTKILSSAIPGGPSAGVQQIHDNAPQPVSGGNVPQPISPSYVYYAGGGGYAPLAGGYNPWDYSTPSIPYSVPQYQIYPQYSAAASQPADRIWEDLILGSSLFL